MLSKDRVHVPVFYAPTSGSILHAIRCCNRGQALGVIIAARDEAATLIECIERVFGAQHTDGWRTPVWIVVIASGCNGEAAKAARKAIGAFGQVVEVDAGSMRASYRIGEELVADHFVDKSARAVAFVSAGASSLKRGRAASATSAIPRRSHRSPRGQRDGARGALALC